MNKSRIVDVIIFTIMDNLKKKSIFVTTILIALLCVLVLPITAFISLDGNKKDKDELHVDKVYIYDSTEFGDAGYENLKSMHEDYKNIEIEYKRLKNKKNILENDEVNNTIKDNVGEACVIAVIKHIKNERINIDITIPKDSKIKKSSASKLGEFLNQFITMRKYQLVAKDEGELLELMAGINVTINTLDKGTDSGILHILKVVVPMVFSIIMYFMLMSYGQSLCNGMITEKSSKIIELLVVHIRPSKLIIGKVLGNVIVAIGQIVIWAISLLAGVKAANVCAYNINGKKFINIDNIIKLIKEANIDSAFSVEAIIIALILLLMGFMFYCIYAAICGSFINKPDEASSVFVFYTYTNVIAFMIVYLGSIMEKKTLVAAVRYIPFCVPYSVPADVILGKISINQALIIAVIMLICIIVIINVLGMVYEKLVFNQLSVKELIKARAK